MISLKSRLEILFDNEQDRADLLTSTQVQRTTIIRRSLRDIVNDSNALEFLKDEGFGLTPDELVSGVPVTFELLQVNIPISIRAALQRFGDVGSNYVSVDITVKLSKRAPSYTIEHNVCNLRVDSCSEARLYKRVERILKDIPSIAANILAEE